MKIFRLFATLLMVALCSMSVTSCSDDDDKNDNTQSSIVGKWKYMTEDTGTRVEFTSKGTFEFTNTKNATVKETGMYKIESGKLHLMFSDETDWEIYKIDELNSVSLVVRLITSDGTYGKTETFQRI